MLVTIDGPSGTGKSSVAKALSRLLHFNYCNTGLMYRTLAYAYLSCSPQSLEVFLKTPPFSFSFSSGELQAFFRGKPLSTHDVSSPLIAKTASELAKKPSVRQFMQKKQQEYAQGDCIFEGRDMGSKVFPHAEVKIFLTASTEVRARRRFKDLPPNSITFKDLLKSLEQRDQEDSNRQEDPLVIPDEALVIDSSNLSFQEVLDSIQKAILKKQAL